VGTFLDAELLDVPKSYDGFIEAMRRGESLGGSYAVVELTSEALFHGFGKAWPCEVGVFTNLTHDHLDAHGTPEHYLGSKAQLFLNIPFGGTAIMNACDPSAELIEEIIPKGVRILRFGVPSRGTPYGEVHALATKVETNFDGTRIELATKGLPVRGGFELKSKAVGQVFAENVIAAWLAAMAAGVPAELAAEAIAAAEAPKGRFEVVGRAPWVVVDYAHTPDALARTVTQARTLCKEGRLLVLFGAGGNRDKNKRGPMGLAASPADEIILTSDNPRDEDARDIAESIKGGITGAAKVVIELDRGTAIRNAIATLGADDVLIIAGRGHETEQIIGKDTRRFSDVETAKEALGNRRS
jgi:UDP-N-acetylmuramoyl-L-alanyl-D-glutamate--2,6-diaminopimelate ligase